MCKFVLLNSFWKSTVNKIMIVLYCKYKIKTLCFLCTVIMCTDLPPPDYGQINYSTDPTSPYDFGTMATYNCDSGFGLVGGKTQTCSGNSSTVVGFWIGVLPTCERTLCH